MHSDRVRAASWLPCGLVLFVLLFTPALASATMPIDPDGAVLILDVRVGSKSDDVLRPQLAEWLRGRGLPVVPTVEASPEFESCAKPACLRALALRAGAQRVLTAHVNESSHVTMVWLFEVGSGLLHQVLEEWGKSSLWASLTRTTELLLRLRPDLKEPGTGISAGSARLPRWRLALSAGLGGLGILGLSIAIGAASKNGDLGPGVCPSMGVERGCFFDTKALFGPAFALSAASLTGAVLTLALPARRPANLKEGQP